MPRRSNDDKDDGAEIVPFPLPKTPAPTNPGPKCTCATTPGRCPACNS